VVDVAVDIGIIVGVNNAVATGFDSVSVGIRVGVNTMAVGIDSVGVGIVAGIQEAKMIAKDTLNTCILMSIDIFNLIAEIYSTISLPKFRLNILYTTFYGISISTMLKMITSNIR